MSTGGDEAFCAAAAGLLAGLPGVRAVALGGSRAWGTARQDSDWDFAVYYRGTGFDPASLRGQADGGPATRRHPHPGGAGRWGQAGGGPASSAWAVV